MPTNLWQPGESGNPAGRKPGSRNRLSEEAISSFLRDWRAHGDHALAKLRRTQPAAYCKLAVLLVPRVEKVEHVNALGGLSDDELAAMIVELEERIASRLQGENATVIDAHVEPALPPLDQPAGAPWKRQPKSSPERLAYARDYMRKRRGAEKASKLAAEQSADAKAETASFEPDVNTKESQ
jgi:hypothetical protein